MSDCPACKQPMSAGVLASARARLEAFATLDLAVRRMRAHQRDWFGGDKSASKLDAARKAEREVDRLLREHASGQGGLF